MFHHFWKKIMSKLSCRSASAAEGSPNLNLLTPTEQKMLLEFMLSRMEFNQREAFMINHPRLYNVLFPGTLKVHVSIVAPAADGTEGRVVCKE